jgi:hypothetical protein
MRIVTHAQSVERHFLPAVGLEERSKHCANGSAYHSATCDRPCAVFSTFVFGARESDLN